MGQPFRNRGRELARLEELWGGSAARFLTISGRRRVGKSRLLGATQLAELLFSRAGFDPNLVARAAAEGVHLVDVGAMYAPGLA